MADKILRRKDGTYRKENILDKHPKKLIAAGSILATAGLAYANRRSLGRLKRSIERGIARSNKTAADAEAASAARDHADQVRHEIVQSATNRRRLTAEDLDKLGRGEKYYPEPYVAEKFRGSRLEKYRLDDRPLMERVKDEARIAGRKTARWGIKAAKQTGSFVQGLADEGVRQSKSLQKMLRNRRANKRGLPGPGSPSTVVPPTELSSGDRLRYFERTRNMNGTFAVEDGTAGPNPDSLIKAYLIRKRKRKMPPELPVEKRRVRFPKSSTIVSPTGEKEKIIDFAVKTKRSKLLSLVRNKMALQRLKKSSVAPKQQFSSPAQEVATDGLDAVLHSPVMHDALYGLKLGIKARSKQSKKKNRDRKTKKQEFSSVDPETKAARLRKMRAMVQTAIAKNRNAGLAEAGVGTAVTGAGAYGMLRALKSGKHIPASIAGSIAATAAGTTALRGIKRRKTGNFLRKMDQRMAEKQNAEFSEKRSKKKTRTSKEVTGSNTGALAGGALASAAGVGALVRSAQPQDVLIKYGYDGKAGGHLTQAEDLQRLLKEEGIRSHLQNAWGSNKRGIVSNIAKVYAKQIPAHAVIDTGWSGPALPNTGKVEWRSDYGSNPKESAIPTLSPDPSPHRPARRKTIAIYGGGSGYDVDNKLRDLAKNVDSSKYDRIHAYAGSSADRVRKELANLPPEIAKKIRVHGPMSRKAIQNAIASHHVNVGNAGLSTAHEIAASRTPGMIYQTKGGGGGPHMERNKNWVKRRGLPAPDPDDAAKTLTRILDNPEGARTQSDRRASRISNEALESRKQLVENVRRAIRVGRIKQAAIGSALLGTGVGVIANSRRKKPAPKQQFSEGESHPPLNKPMRGDVKKSKVYVRHPETGNIVKVNFGDKTMKIRKNEPDRRKSFRARHNCDNPGPKHKARYWSCRAW